MSGEGKPLPLCQAVHSEHAVKIALLEQASLDHKESMRQILVVLEDLRDAVKAVAEFRVENRSLAEKVSRIESRQDYHGQSMDDFNRRLSSLEGAGPWQTWTARLLPAAVIAGAISFAVKYMGG